MGSLADSWQWIAVVIVEVAALAYLGRKMFGRAAPKTKRGPDVPVSALLRKKKAP